MNRRTLIAGGSVLAILLVVVVAGYFLVSNQKDNRSNSRPTPSPTDPRVEIEQAYLSFWKVYADAALNLDPDLVERVATGAALNQLKAQIQNLRDSNQPVRISVEHNYRIIYPVPGAQPDTASVDDRYINHTVRLDPQTKEPTEADQKTQTHDTYTMKKVDGIWKVAEIIEQR